MAVYLAVFGVIAMIALFEKPKTSCLDSGNWLLPRRIKSWSFRMTLLATVIIVQMADRDRLGSIFI